MSIRIAINGFGRIGRLTLRALIESQKYNFQIVGINDLGPLQANAFMLKHDSVHGLFPKEITYQDNVLIIDKNKITFTSEADPEKLPWKDMGIDIVFECSGQFTDYSLAKKHIIAGAKKVLISAPGKNVDRTIVYGINHHTLTKTDTIISNASCTTNCLAPIASVLDKTFGIQKGFMTTVHAYTGDQKLVDSLHKDLHRSRGAAMSMIPTSTGAAKTLGQVLPNLEGKLDGTAIRVPTPNVSMIDFSFTTATPCSKDKINDCIIEASKEKDLQNILTTTTEPLVSVDFNHNSSSAIFDLNQTYVLEGGTFGRVQAWYDNEWGFSNRMLDTATIIGNHLL